MDIFKGKTVLITGASKGIGREFARQLDGFADTLILVARSEFELNQVRLELKGLVSVHIIVSDLTDLKSPQYIYQEVNRLGLSVDYLINNAGFGVWDNFLDYENQKNIEMVNLNINALVSLCHLFLPQIVKNNYGGVINVGSTGSIVPVAGSAAYCATKAFVLHFTDALHAEYANDKIRIMTLCPGGTATNFTDVASSGRLSNSKTQMSAEEVVKIGLKAFCDKKIYKVAGKYNYVTSVIMSRILTRKKFVYTVKKAWINMMESRENNK